MVELAMGEQRFSSMAIPFLTVLSGRRRRLLDQSIRVNTGMICAFCIHFILGFLVTLFCSVVNFSWNVTLTFCSYILYTRYDYRAGFWGVMGQPCLGMIPVRELILDLLCYHTLVISWPKLLTWSPCCSHILRNLTILCLRTVLAEILVCSLMAENFTRRTWIYLWVEGFPILLIDHTELRFLVKYPTKYLAKSFIALANLHQRK